MSDFHRTVKTITAFIAFLMMWIHRIDGAAQANRLGCWMPWCSALKCFRQKMDGGFFAGNVMKPLSNLQRLHQVNTEQLFENYRSALNHAPSYQ